jgi:hypothetical protein
MKLENGLICEKMTNIKNKETFEVRDQMVWVDLCVECCEVWFSGKRWENCFISEGVTTPKLAVELSKKSGWSQTAGLFIAEKYGWNAKDWHGTMAEKSRQMIMEELIKSSFGCPFMITLPQITSVFKPDVYHQYVTQPIDFFVPEETRSGWSVSTKFKWNYFDRRSFCGLL